MYSLIQLLRNIGLSEKEAITYLVCLKIGTNPASVIARHADLNRCTTYSVLESLIKKGLVHQFEKNKIRYFTSIEPKELLIYIDEMKRDLKYYKDEIDELLPEFESLKHPYHTVPIVKSYSGKAGITKIFHEVLKEDTVSIWARPSKRKSGFFSRFAPILINKQKEFRLIIQYNDKAQKYHISSSDNLKEIKTCKPIEFIGNNRLFLFSFNQPNGIEIANSEIVQLFQRQFNETWKK